MPIFNQQRKLLIIIILGVVFLGLFISHKYRAPKRNYSDFNCFYTAGKRVLEQKDIYVLRDQETAEFRYAPIFAVLMSGLALMDRDSADTVWFMINFFLLIITFIFLKKLIIKQKLDFKRSFILYALTIVGTFRFILHNFDAGQTNILMLASIIMGLYFIAQKREIVGGAIFAFSIMIKYTPLVFIPYFLVKRKFKLSFVIIISVIIYFLLPSLFIGFKKNIFYLKNLLPFLTQSTIFDQMTVLDPKNQSLLSMISRFFTYCIAYFHAPPMPFQSWNLSAAKINLIFVSAAIFLYLMVFCNPKRRDIAKDSSIYYNIDYAQLLICVILFNLNSWKPNYILLAMAYFIVLYYLLSVRFKDIVALMLLIISYILNLITMDAIFGKTITYKLCFYSPLTISALITFALLFKIKFSKSPNFN